MALALVARGAAECHAVIQGAVVTDFRGLSDHHTHAVIDEEAPADLCAGMDFYTGQTAADVRDEPGEPVKAAAPEPVRQPMHEHGVKTGVTGNHLPGVPRRGI